MSVVCAACKTENRANAMFCRGCAAKLPGFAATGPSALEGMKPVRTAPAPAQAPGPTPGMLPIETRAFWIRFAVLSIVITACFGSWVAYVTRKPPAPAPAAVAAAPAARAAPVRASAPPAAPLDRVPMVPSVPVRTVETLGPAETIVEPGPVRSEPERPIASYQPTVPVERTVPPRKIVARNDGNGGNGAADPRPGCAHLNFIAAARCEAAQCAKSPFNHHPHCNAVREQTRRDIARRNPSF
ncbi:MULTISPECIES: hypothetical protein [unclassified Variovorax]|uniref:hypothetical protein n=1 Tax=unclassified Variovorax TaxID=663243 RepID=UPI0008809122|nr:hypothetical protein [Variovorax sp. CF079]SDE09176.1 hypothetical protein SAMN05444679_11755 [Variovorax sp. CF079]